MKVIQKALRLTQIFTVVISLTFVWVSPAQKLRQKSYFEQLLCVCAYVCVCIYIYIYIYILYICIQTCVCVCVCVRER